MSKKKSEIVSGAGFVAEFITSLFNRVRELGGDDEIIYSALKTESKTIDEIAKIIISKVIELPNLISYLNLDRVNENIIEENFPIQPEDQSLQKEYKIFNFEKITSSYEVIKEMNEFRYRPATSRELLFWAKNNWNRKDFIIALGQKWIISSCGDDVMGICWNGKCELELYRFESSWYAYSNFLAVHK